MSKLSLQQRISQKLSPLQIQYIKLLQIPVSELSDRILEEVESNPALESTTLEASSEIVDDFSEADSQSLAENASVANEKSRELKKETEASLDELTHGDKDYDYRTRQEYDPESEQYEAPIIGYKSLYDKLLEQVEMTQFSEIDYEIALQVIGSIDEDGYLRTEIAKIADDLSFRKNLSINDEDVDRIIHKIQLFDPPGVGATNLQECLLIQLSRFPESIEIQHAKKIIRLCWEEFSKKHFDKIIHKINITEDQFRTAYVRITKLNPKPGESQSDEKHQQIIPDFILMINDEATDKETKIQIELNRKTTPDIKVSKRYKKMLEEYQTKVKNGNKAAKEALQFLQEKIESARAFIEALKQRQDTLTQTMKQIADRQKEYFLSKGDISKLKPMILKDIAYILEMDISTVSRVANSKYVQTDWGIFQLKYFFSEGIATESGEEVSNREIKDLVQQLIDNEDKTKPLSDERLCELLNEKGYNIARRTVAKYREQLNIPVARLRREII